MTVLGRQDEPATAGPEPPPARPGSGDGFGQVLRPHGGPRRAIAPPVSPARHRAARPRTASAAPASRSPASHSLASRSPVSRSAADGRPTSR
ncbi:hypothetical protein [Streptomyces sp. NPDC059895]|uniref:hypothetical protein n=1 Tax=Streptomyces sp. NPDC059895 TaxID=3346992 RepID=UPI00364BE454